MKKHPQNEEAKNIYQEPPSELLQSIINLYNQGQLQQALSESNQMLEHFPNSVVLYNISGASNAGLMQFDAAIDSYKQALKIKPDYAEAYYNMSVALNDKGDPEAAIDSYKQALKIKPDYAEAYNNMGVAMNDKGDPEAAIDSYKQALKIKPDYAEAYNNIGNVLKDQGDLEAAIDSYKQVLKIKPDYAEAYNNMGVAMNDKGDPEAAIDSYKQALKIKPDYAEAYNNMGVAMNDKGDPEAAIESYKQALMIKPDYAEAYNNIGIVLKDQGDLEAAIESYKQALKIKPDYAEAYNNIGIVLKDQGDLEAAIESYKQAINIKPDYADAYSNIGNVLKDQGDLEAAIDSYKQAININPDYAEAYYNLSLLHLLRGNLDEGFKYYEWRLKIQKPTAAPVRTNLIWDGEQSLSGKHFVVYEEQGLGDIIQFCRYLPVLEQKGANVTFKVKSNLHALLQTMDSKTSLNTRLPEENKIDFELPMMSLPLALKTTVETIPAQIPYLYADDQRKKRWNEKLGNKTVTRIGLVWSGSTLHKNDHNRSLLLNQLTSLLVLPVEFHSLQKEVREIDIKTLTDFPKINQHQDDLLDFSDTAALIDEMDLVISVDTVVAHLSGAMGKKTFILLPYSPDFRWMLDRADSPWYPTATLFRQPSVGDWDSVISEIRQLLSD